MKITAITRFKQGDLYQALKRLGWTQHELARRSGLPDSTLGTYLNLKRRPSLAHAEKIQKALAEGGEYVDIMALWPESFIGSRKAIKVEQTKEFETFSLADPDVFDRVLALPEPDHIDEDLMGDLESAISRLKERDQLVLRYRIAGKSLEEIAKLVGLDSRERIRQIVAYSLRTLRKDFKKRGYEVSTEVLHSSILGWDDRRNKRL